MTLLEAKAGTEYIVRDLFTDDEEMDNFLFSLGCYGGEPITVPIDEGGRPESEGISSEGQEADADRLG